MALTGGWPRASRLAIGGSSRTTTVPLSAISLCSAGAAGWAATAQAAPRAIVVRIERCIVLNWTESAAVPTGVQ